MPVWRVSNLRGNITAALDDDELDTKARSMIFPQRSKVGAMTLQRRKRGTSMKIYATVVAAAVLITSPIKAAAQSSASYEQCVGDCYTQYQAARDYCNSRYGDGNWWIIDRDWCEYDASQQAEQCTDYCSVLYPSAVAYNQATQRYRPVMIEALALITPLRTRS